MRFIGHFLMAGAISAVVVVSGTAAFAKTTAACNAEYAANKPAIQAARQTKTAFIKACLAGKETVPVTSAPASPPPSPSSGY